MKKMKCIQGIRGGAIILIVLWHLNSIFPSCLPAFGDRGVEFFFLISGLLIGMKYFGSGKMDDLKYTTKYAVSKAKKIYPLYISTKLLMLISLVMHWRKHEIGTVKLLSIVGTNLLCLQSWVPSEDYYWALNSATWFLSDLLFCYLTTFVFFWIIKKINVKVIISILFVLKFVWELFVQKQFPDQSPFLTYIFPVYRSLDFGIGISIGVLTKQTEKKNLDKQLVVLLVIYAAMMILFNKKLTYSVYHVIEALLVWNIVMNRGKVVKFLFENSIIVKMGNMSETIFLTHLPVISYMRVLWEKLIGNQYRLLEWISILICIFIVAYVVEKFQNKLRESNMFLKHKKHTISGL